MEDDLLPLQTDVFGPLDEAGQVLLGGDVTAWARLAGQGDRAVTATTLTNAEGLRALLEERVLGDLGGLLGAVCGRQRWFGA